jgi:hypothetical protein
MVQIARSRYEVLPPESSRMTVERGRTIAIPLYDGDLVALADPNPVLRYIGTVSGPAIECIRTSAGSAASHRLALFRVIGRSSEGATLLVRLRLPELHEKCTSCRTVHFFVHVR